MSENLLEGKVALVTGASRGIGRSIAETFARHGASLVIAASGEEIDTVADHLKALGGNVVAIRGDLANEQFVKDLVLRCREVHRRIDVLVNNAGILNQSLMGMTKAADFRRMFDINVMAVFQLMQFATRLMGNSVSPSIINIASIAGTQGIEGATAYSASKAAVVGLTISAAKELAPKIRVNAIAPGFIDSQMTRTLPPELFQKRLAGIRMGRLGEPQDIANCALFLASELSSYVTGQVIGVDGGMVV